MVNGAWLMLHSTGCTADATWYTVYGAQCTADAMWYTVHGARLDATIIIWPKANVTAVEKTSGL